MVAPSVDLHQLYVGLLATSPVDSAVPVPVWANQQHAALNRSTHLCIASGAPQLLLPCPGPRAVDTSERIHVPPHVRLVAGTVSTLVSSYLAPPGGFLPSAYHEDNLLLVQKRGEVQP